MTPSKATVEERAARFQRRYTGPWQTVSHEVGGIEITYRRRRRRHIDSARLNVAGHDLWTHAIWRGLVVPTLRPIAGRLARWID